MCNNSTCQREYFQDFVSYFIPFVTYRASSWPFLSSWNQTHAFKLPFVSVLSYVVTVNSMFEWWQSHSDVTGRYNSQPQKDVGEALGSEPPVWRKAPGAGCSRNPAIWMTIPFGTWEAPQLQRLCSFLCRGPVGELAHLPHLRQKVRRLTIQMARELHKGHCMLGLCQAWPQAVIQPQSAFQISLCPMTPFPSLRKEVHFHCVSLSFPTSHIFSPCWDSWTSEPLWASVLSHEDGDVDLWSTYCTFED